jgi:hypothetical protein
VVTWTLLPPLRFGLPYAACWLSFSRTRRGRCGSRTPTRLYPGRAHHYPERTEVDHQALVERLVADFPDGWALSTSAEALQQGPM